MNLLRSMVDAKVETSTSSLVRHSEKWQSAVGLLSRMVDAEVEANTISYSAALRGVADRIELAEQNGRRQRGSEHHQL